MSKGKNLALKDLWKRVMLKLQAEYSWEELRTSLEKYGTGKTEAQGISYTRDVSWTTMI